MLLPVVIIAVFSSIALCVAVFIHWGTRWGSTPEERAERMPGDEHLAGGPSARVVMTRAVSIEVAPDIVWPWLAQLGRGAGFYSLDRLDNGGRMSARHIISWVPAPRLGDASAIGYLREITPGSAITWWVPGLRFLGGFARLVTDIRLRPRAQNSRLVIRMSADAEGLMAQPALWVFRIIDSIMACIQLRRLKDRIEAHGARSSDPEHPETGSRDQFQYYEVIYASGERAGVRGKEDAARWHRAAVEAGVIHDPHSPGE
jgi:hypothetical protein